MTRSFGFFLQQLHGYRNELREQNDEQALEYAKSIAEQLSGVHHCGAEDGSTLSVPHVNRMLSTVPALRTAAEFAAAGDWESAAESVSAAIRLVERDCET